MYCKSDAVTEQWVLGKQERKKGKYFVPQFLFYFSFFFLWFWKTCVGENNIQSIGVFVSAWYPTKYAFISVVMCMGYEFRWFKSQFQMH